MWCLFRSLAHFHIGLFVTVEFLEIFVYFRFLRYVFCKYFLLVCALCLYSLSSVLVDSSKWPSLGAQPRWGLFLDPGSVGGRVRQGTPSSALSLHGTGEDMDPAGAVTD